MLQDKKLRKNLIYLILLYIINYLSPFLTIPYLSRILSTEHYGVILYCTVFVAYLNIICDYGFNLSGLKETALKHDDPEALRKIVSNITAVKLIIFCLSLFFGCIVIFYLPKFKAYWYLYLVSMLGLLNNVFFPAWFFRGIEEMKFVTLVGVLMKTLTILLILGLIHKDEQYYLVPYINTASSIICAVTAQIILFTQLNFRYVMPDYKSIVYYVKSSWNYFLSSIATSLYGVANSLLLGIFSTPVAVAYYVPAEKLIAVVIDFIGVVSQAVFPNIVRQVNKDKASSIKLLQKNFYIFLLSGAILSASIWILSSIIIKLILGDNYHDTVFVLRILAIIPLMASINSVLATQAVIPFGFSSSYARVLVAGGILNIILIFILVPRFSYIGSAIAVSITEMVIPLFMAYILFKNGIFVWIGKIRYK